MAKFFGAGYLRISGNTCHFTVGGIHNLISVIVPHFDKYPLQTKKMGDYMLLKQALNRMQNNAHLNAQGIAEVVNIKAAIN